jgi:hypothetical protein
MLCCVPFLVSHLCQYILALFLDSQLKVIKLLEFFIELAFCHACHDNSLLLVLGKAIVIVTVRVS